MCKRVRTESTEVKMVRCAVKERVLDPVGRTEGLFGARTERKKKTICRSLLVEGGKCYEHVQR